MTAVLAERPAPTIQHQGGALAVRPDQTAWTPEQAAVLRQSGIKDNVAPAELSSFLHLCQRTGLDPFSRQIYLIGRWSKKDGRDVYTPQTGIDGYRVIAQRVTRETGGTYGYEDTVWCDASGRWRDVWLAEAPPAAAKVTVIRNGQRFSAVAAFREYVQTFPDGNPKGLWGRMPAGQIAKCAEALALRKAFPHDLAGIYTAEEMAQADNGAPEQPPAPVVQQQAAPPQPERRDYLAEAPPAPPADVLSPQARAMLDAAAAATTPEEYAEVRTAAEQAGAPAPFLARLEVAAADMLATATAAGEQPRTATPHSMADAEAAAGAYTPEEHAAMDRAAGHAAAENALRLAASRANLPDLDDAFARVFGKPIADAPAETLNAFRQRIEAAAQQGAQQ